MPVFATNGLAVSDGQTYTLGRVSRPTLSNGRQVALSWVGHGTSASVVPSDRNTLSSSRYGRRETKALDPPRLTLVADMPLHGVPDPSQPKRPAGKKPFTSWWLWRARPICLRLLEHFIRLAASRIFCTAGSNRPMRMAMMAITTSNSIRVNPGDGLWLVRMSAPVGNEERKTEPAPNGGGRGNTTWGPS